MSFELGVGKKQNRQGRVELSVRFRLGKIDYQAKTNLWISPAFVKTEKYVSSKGKPSTRLVLTSSRTKTEEAVHADEVIVLWSRLLTYIVSEYIRLKETSNPFQSHTRKQGYLTIRRSLLRYEIYRQITNPRFLLTIEAVDENLLKDFENFQINEHKLVEEFPQLSATEETNARVGEKSLNTISVLLRPYSIGRLTIVVCHIIRLLNSRWDNALMARHIILLLMNANDWKSMISAIHQEMKYSATYSYSTAALAVGSLTCLLSQRATSSTANFTMWQERQKRDDLKP